MIMAIFKYLRQNFFIFNVKVYNNEFTYDTTCKLPYDTNTVPGGAIYHDYPLTFNINLRNTTKTKYTLKYKVYTRYKYLKQKLFTNNYLSRFHTGRQANIAVM